MNHLCYYQGRFCPVNEVLIPISDYIIQRGVGVFDLVRTYDRRPMQLSDHLERLLRSAEEVGIAVPWTMEYLRKLICQGIQRLEGEVLAKIYITGGDDFVDQWRFPNPRLFLTFDTLEPPDPKIYESGVRLYPVHHGRANPTAKSIDYLSSYEKDRDDPAAFEVLYCPDGEITEAAHSSFFLVHEGRVLTAPADRVLVGTTRAVVIQLMEEQSIPLELTCPTMDELAYAQEAFISGSIKQIVPVVQVGYQVIGGGVPGPMTRRIAELFRQNIHRWVE